MANSVNVQVIEDGPRNSVIKVEGILDTSDLSGFVVANPKTLATIDPAGQLYCKNFRIARYIHNVEDGLEVRVYWDDTIPVRAEELSGRGYGDYRHTFGGLTPNTSEASTGNIFITTEGWSSGKILSFTVVFNLIKQGTGSYFYRVPSLLLDFTSQQYFITG